MIKTQFKFWALIQIENQQKDQIKMRIEFKMKVCKIKKFYWFQIFFECISTNSFI